MSEVIEKEGERHWLEFAKTYMYISMVGASATRVQGVSQYRLRYGYVDADVDGFSSCENRGVTINYATRSLRCPFSPSACLS